MESDFASSVMPPVPLRRQPALRPALRANIQRFGVLVPVVRDQHGGMIDGSHRARSDRVFS
jgi:hypothetical protein